MGAEPPERADWLIGAEEDPEGPAKRSGLGASLPEEPVGTPARGRPRAEGGACQRAPFKFG